jgi:hypothetical protein
MNVPKACAKNGKIKCFASMNGIAATNPFSVVRSKPFGIGIIVGPILIKAMFTFAPTKMATIKIKLLRSAFFMCNKL